MTARTIKLSDPQPSVRHASMIGHGAPGLRPVRFLAALGLVAFAVITVSGCSWSSRAGGGIEYKSAKSLPPLELPPQLSRPARDDRFQLPEAVAGSAQGSSATASGLSAERAAGPKAGTTDVLPDTGKIRMQRAGSERWLVVPEDPDRLWPLVREFWQNNGFLLKTEQPETGVMETDWAENRARIPNDGIRSLISTVFNAAYSTGTRDKFRTRLERGTDAGTTEVYISHRGMVETIVNTSAGSENTKWQPSKPDPDLEAEFLRRLMVRLGMDDAQAKTTLAAVKPPAEERARIGAASGGLPSLALSEPFDRAWRRVGLALDRVGFTVEDRDRSKGLYFVRYVDPATDVKKDAGFLGKLAFWRSDPPRATDRDQFRVQIRDTANDSSVVQVLNREGTADASPTARRILGLLQEQLK